MREMGDTFAIMLHKDGRLTAIMAKPVSSIENHIACVVATREELVKGPVSRKTQSTHIERPAAPLYSLLLNESQS